MSDTEQLYYDWLLDKVITLHDYELQGIYVIMFYTAFEVFHDRDVNRMQDAIDLRDRFYSQSGIEVPQFMPISVLEVLVALTLRIGESILCGDNDDVIHDLFKAILRNIGLTQDLYADDEEIERLLYIFMSRQYDYDGSNGGAFVIREPRADLRTTELWYQAMWYINENYR